MQIKMDGQNFCATMETKHKVKNLSNLRKTVKISGVPLRVIDSLALFNRLIMISDRGKFVMHFPLS